MYDIDETLEIEVALDSIVPKMRAICDDALDVLVDSMSSDAERERARDVLARFGEMLAELRKFVVPIGESLDA